MSVKCQLCAVGSHTLLTVIWSFIFLKEHGLAQRLPASVMMVIGAILIAA